MSDIKEGETFIHNDVEYTAHSIEYNEFGNVVSIEDFNHDRIIFFKQQDNDNTTMA